MTQRIAPPGWVLDEDGRFVEPVAQATGVLVAMADCETLEFFGWDDARGVSDAQGNDETE
jgi:hypothetical protein